MSKRLTLTAASAALLALVFSTAALGAREEERAGNLFLADNGGIWPTKLPRRESVPITARLDGEVGTVDGSHPPALQALTVDIDKTIKVNAVGIPTCRLRQIEATPTVTAKKACSSAMLGSGEAEVEVAFPEQRPFSAKGPILLFNGGVHGHSTTVFVYAYVAVPAPTAIVTVARITPIHRGRFGLRLAARIPPIAGGAGSVTKFQLGVSRRFTYRGKRESFLTASCPTGHYVTEGEVSLSDGTKIGLTHVFPCTPEG